MFGLGKHGPDGRYGAIVDIGSGSVGVAIVASDPTQPAPEFIWSHRERMILRDVDSPAEASRHITTALLNTMLALGSEGQKKLQAHESDAQIDLIQVTIAAPWSYTIGKTVRYKQPESFTVTKKLISELIETARKQSLEVIDENDVMRKLGLEVITRATINVAANDYDSADPIGQDTKSLSISHVSAISQQQLLTALAEGVEKVLPETDLERYSFMLTFYCVLRELAPDTNEVCLIDVTAEATEIGIVRDGILRYATHAPFGIYTIARDIANLCDLPKEEALTYINGNTDLIATLTPEKASELEAILLTYRDRIADLFKRTGDALSIPRPLFIHTDQRTEAFFSEQIKAAATKATKSEHGVHLVTSKLLQDETISDTALLLSANFFHNLHGCEGFEQV